MRLVPYISIFFLFTAQLCAQTFPAFNPNCYQPRDGVLREIISISGNPNWQGLDTLYPQNALQGVIIGDSVRIAHIGLIYPNSCSPYVTTVNWYIGPPDAQVPFRWVGADNYSPPHSADVFFFPSTTDTIMEFVRFENFYDVANHPECSFSKQFVVGIRGYGIKPIQKIPEEVAASEKKIQLYPNPASTMITISLIGWNKDCELQIFDVLGNFISNLSSRAGDKEIKVDISKLQKGFYTAMIRSNGKIFSRKFVVSGHLLE